METILAVITGIGLSAACGFRVFAPLLLINLGALSGYVSPAAGFEWAGTYQATVVFGVAALLEIAAYYIPWLDNALDAVATPAAIMAGIAASAAVISDVPPLIKWTTAVIAGGGIAGLVQGATAGLRVKSSLFTGGLSNAVVSTFELIGSLVTAVLAVFLPVLAIVVVAAMAVLILWLVGRGFLAKRRPPGGSSPSP